METGGERTHTTHAKQDFFFCLLLYQSNATCKDYKNPHITHASALPCPHPLPSSPHIQHTYNTITYCGVFKTIYQYLKLFFIQVSAHIECLELFEHLLLYAAVYSSSSSTRIHLEDTVRSRFGDFEECFFGKLAQWVSSVGFNVCSDKSLKHASTCFCCCCCGAMVFLSLCITARKQSTVIGS